MRVEWYNKIKILNADSSVSIKFYSSADLAAVPSSSSHKYAKYVKQIDKTFHGKMHCRHCLVMENQV